MSGETIVRWILAVGVGLIVLGWALVGILNLQLKLGPKRFHRVYWKCAAALLIVFGLHDNGVQQFVHLVNTYPGFLMLTLGCYYLVNGSRD